MIKYSEIKSLFKKTDIQCEEYKLEVFEAISLPFIVYFIESNNSFSADGNIYLNLVNVQLELVTDGSNSDYEKQVESILAENNVYFSKTLEFDETNRLFLAVYNFVANNEQ